MQAGCGGSHCLESALRALGFSSACSYPGALLVMPVDPLCGGWRPQYALFVGALRQLAWRALFPTPAPTHASCETETRHAYARRMATGGEDKVVRVFDIRSGKVAAQLPEFSSRIRTLVHEPLSKTLSVLGSSASPIASSSRSSSASSSACSSCPCASPSPAPDAT